MHNTNIHIYDKMLKESKLRPVVHFHAFYMLLSCLDILPIFVHIVDAIRVLSRSFFNGSVDRTPNFCAIG